MTRTATESRVESRDLSALYAFGGAGACALMLFAMALGGQASVRSTELRAPDRTTVRHLS